MKTVSIRLVAVLAVCACLAGQTQAASNTYAVKLVGSICANGAQTPITDANLVASNHFLLAVVNPQASTIDLLEAAGAVTNPVIVQTLLQSLRAAILSNNSFAATLVAGPRRRHTHAAQRSGLRRRTALRRPIRD